jgi:hypothetical protein
MKAILLAAAATGAAVMLGACATAAPTAWGKANVSKNDYGTDIGMCTGIAAMKKSEYAANTAGGLKRGGSGLEPTQAGAPATSPVVMGGGVYRDNTPVDVSSRAASQQNAQNTAAQRLQADAFRGCLTERGYQEFTLTPEQSAHLRTLKPGSNEYHEYLFKLGADPQVLATQKAARAGS